MTRELNNASGETNETLALVLQKIADAYQPAIGSIFAACCREAASRLMALPDKGAAGAEPIIAALNEALNRIWEVFDDAASGYEDEDGDKVVQTPEDGFVAACEAIEALADKLTEPNGWLGRRVAVSLRKAIAHRPLGGWRPSHKHVKSGRLYMLIDEDVWLEADDSRAVLYQGDDGRRWVRSRDEFFDSRFDPLPTPSEKD